MSIIIKVYHCADGDGPFDGQMDRLGLESILSINVNLTVTVTETGTEIVCVNGPQIRLLRQKYLPTYCREMIYFWYHILCTFYLTFDNMHEVLIVYVALLIAIKIHTKVRFTPCKFDSIH